MIQPTELKQDLPMEIHGGLSTTHQVWEILVASREGNLEKVQAMTQETPGLLYAQYNYTPPIHFAVREGHADLTDWLLQQGALDPTYRIYPFLDSLLVLAQDRENATITRLLQEYLADPSRCRWRGDTGAIHYNRSQAATDFEQAVDKGDLDTTTRLLKEQPSLALDETFFWGEGILCMPAKKGDYKMMELLMQYGAQVPRLLKWGQYYYFERYEPAVFLLEHGMDPNTRSWHQVTLLHDMAQKGLLEKAALLIQHGADINPVEEEYQSTPLGMAARWGHAPLVDLLLRAGADPNKAGAPWATPLSWATRRGHQEIIALLKQHNAHE